MPSQRIPCDGLQVRREGKRFGASSARAHVCPLTAQEGDQQEEALIFSETSGSDLATRKRRRPPPRRIRSTALQGEKKKEKSPVTGSSAETGTDQSKATNGVGTAPLVVCSDQTGPVHGQDAISDPQSAVGGRRPVWDEGPDVDARSVERSVLQGGEGSHCLRDHLIDGWGYFLSIDNILHTLL